MKHLYIIGNGFDIHTGLATKYSDFCKWLENNYPFIYENMYATYGMDGEWWNDFEAQLGKLDIKKYVEKFSPPVKTVDEVMAKIEQRNALEKKYNMPISMLGDAPCSRRLRGMLDVLQYCFEKWIENCQSSIFTPQYIHIEKEDSFFINFNYTDVLECLYEIPEESVLHIHGRASKGEHLIYGHSDRFCGNLVTYDEQQVDFELGLYYKNPYEYIYKHLELTDVLKDIEYIHVYGFSFSEIDEDYIDWIYKNVPLDSKWEVSWFTVTDQKRIDKFVLNYIGLKDRLNLIRLEDINEK